MSYGTSAPPVDPSTMAAASNVAPATTAANSKGMTDNQMKAIAMLMGNLGKGGHAVPVSNAPQVQNMGPRTNTVQGGTYFNPNQPR